jgi:hypothetical protein
MKIHPNRSRPRHPPQGKVNPPANPAADPKSKDRSCPRRELQQRLAAGETHRSTISRLAAASQEPPP